MTGHGGDVKGCDWHPTKAVLASGSKDGLVKVWDAKTGRNIATLHGHRNTVMQTLWNANGNWLLSACRDQSLKVRPGTCCCGEADMMDATSCDMLMLILLRIPSCFLLQTLFLSFLPLYPEELICDASLHCVHQLHTLHEHAVTALLQQCCASDRCGCCWVTALTHCMHVPSFIHYTRVFPQGQLLTVQGSSLYEVFFWQAAYLQCHVWMLMLTCSPCRGCHLSAALQDTETSLVSMK